MGEINTLQKGSKNTRQALRIDFTPMVDLGFILITFFIYTTTMAEPKTLELKMPSNEKPDAPTAFIEESTITLISVSGHNVFYYGGALQENTQLKSKSVRGILGALLDKKKEVAALPSSYSTEAHKLHVLIKPGEDCKYEDVVELLDDMIIADVPYYAIVDISSVEKELIAKSRIQNK